MRKLPREGHKVSTWSGGSTTQVYIFPEDADYGKRDFLFRVSSAGVDCDRSDFTPLPGVERHIMVLKGALRLLYEGHGEKDLNVDRFLADSYKRGNHQGILEHPQCMEVYEHIGVEVLKLVNFYHFTYRQSQLEGVYLLGGGGQIQPLRQVLEETLGLPAMPLEGLLPWKEDAPKNESSFICASGLILDQEEEG